MQADWRAIAEKLQREVKERKTSYDQLLTSWAESRERHLAAEADKARLSEALRAIAYGESRIVGELVTIARAALSGSGSGWREPDGWKLVPVEPDDAMIEAGQDTCEEKNCWGGRVYASDIWESMLAACPAAPQQGGE